MFLIASFEQNLKFKRCFNLRFLNDFKIKKVKEKNAHLLVTECCVI